MTREAAVQTQSAPTNHPLSQSGILQRKCASCGQHKTGGEACTKCQSAAPKLPVLQTKLTVGQPDDKYEKEADRVAEQIMRMPAPESTGTLGVRSQPPKIQRKCTKCDDEQRLQMKERPGGTPEVTPAVASRIQSLQGSGQPLSDSARSFFEPRFGQDFSHIRVQTDSQSTQALNAKAYTIGRNIVLGTGQYSPDTVSGRQLLAHELTHTIQQSATINTAIPDLQRLGANPGCSDAQRDTIHQSIYNARGWLLKAISQLGEAPLSDRTVAALRRNFGPTYGVRANASLIRDRLRVAYQEVSTIPFTCSAADALCPGPCGHAVPGSHAATICVNPTLQAGADWRYQAGCILHESLHAAFSRFTVDEYSGWHGASGSTPTYPGGGTDPLLNADSYTTLSMDLS